MGDRLTGTMSLEDRDEMHVAGATTPVANWVIALDGLSATSHLLYLRMCRVAMDDEHYDGTRLTLTEAEADEWAQGEGKGREALDELTRAKAIKKLRQNPDGRMRYLIESYPPDYRERRNQGRRINGLPVVSYV